MSAPSTNVETQERRHKPVLVILRVLIGAALLALAGFIGYQIGSAGSVPEAASGSAIEAAPGGQTTTATD